MKPSQTISIATLLLGTTTLGGCLPQNDDEADIYRTALPIRESVTLGGPESSQSTTADQTTDAPVGAPISKYYAFTREIRNGVNRVTASILGTVWYIANTKPTDVENNEAIWGPYTDPLEPATWRFRITRIAGEEYAYTLEGRPKESNSNADYITVLDGTGFGRKDDRHGDGVFNIDLDAAKSLDPLAHDEDSGTITVSHDLPATVTEQFAPLPRRIEVKLAPSKDATHLDILSLAREDNTGLLVVAGTADVDESHATLLEDVSIASQWRADGTGRADVSIASGDVPATLSPVVAVECWDRHFKQSYYTDSAGISSNAGDVNACAFANAAVDE